MFRYWFSTILATVIITVLGILATPRPHVEGADSTNDKTARIAEHMVQFRLKQIDENGRYSATVSTDKISTKTTADGAQILQLKPLRIETLARETIKASLGTVQKRKQIANLYDFMYQGTNSQAQMRKLRVNMKTGIGYGAGKVQVTMQNSSSTADEIIINKNTRHVELRGNVKQLLTRESAGSEP